MAHSPIDEKERDGEDDLDAGPGEVAPVADVGEAEALHELVQVLHVLPRHRVDVLAPQGVLHDQLVKLLYLVARRECSEVRLGSRNIELELDRVRIELKETG